MERYTPEVRNGAHEFHKCNDDECFACTGGLKMCDVCNGAEGTLPRSCPGKPLTEEQLTLIMNGELDFDKGWWFYRFPFTIQPQDPSMALIQYRVNGWLRACVGDEVTNDLTERNNRFAEEAIELLQACGYSYAQLVAMADHVYAKEAETDIAKEAADVLICLAPLATARNIELGEAVSGRIDENWDRINLIREKNRNKPIRSGEIKV